MMVEASKSYIWFGVPYKALNHPKSSSRNPCGPNWRQREEGGRQAGERQGGGRQAGGWQGEGDGDMIELWRGTGFFGTKKSNQDQI